MHRTFLPVFFAVSFLAFTNSSQTAFSTDVVVSDSAKEMSSRAGHSIRKTFERSVLHLYDSMDLGAYGLGYDVFRLGLIGYHNLRNSGALNEKNLLTIIDFTKPGTEKRFYIIDLDKRLVRFHTYVAHGRNTGGDLATAFSNRMSSNQSSLGFYVTGETYVGSKGYSLRLNGKDGNYNSNLRKRAVVIHAADYVGESWIQRYGRLGRSFGCPALPNAVSGEVIDTIKDGTAIFAYYPDEQYLRASEHLDVDRLMEHLANGPGALLPLGAG